MTTIARTAQRHTGHGNMDLPIKLAEPLRCGVCDLPVFRAGNTTLAAILRAADEHINHSEAAGAVPLGREATVHDLQARFAARRSS